MTVHASEFGSVVAQEVDAEMPSESSPTRAEDPPAAAALPAAKKPQQLKLFSLGGAWEGRFEATFFRAIPRAPGVYFFRDEAGKLLYIGQSHNLRDRVGSYRHVSGDRHPPRTCRMVSRVRQITWELCDSPQAAIRREKELLLEHRPCFNRAGVWQAPSWWLRIEQSSPRLWVICPIKEPSAPPLERCHGPYPSSFPYVLAALVRIFWRECHPTHTLLDWPAGWRDFRRVSETQLRLTEEKTHLREYLEKFLDGSSDQLILTSRDRWESSSGISAFEAALWEADLEMLTDFHARRGSSTASNPQSADVAESALAEYTLPL